MPGVTKALRFCEMVSSTVPREIRRKSRMELGHERERFGWSEDMGRTHLVVLSERNRTGA